MKKNFAPSNKILNSMKNWFLGMDSVPLDPTETEIYLKKNYPWNYAVNMIDGATFWFGASFISASTILPLFLTKLTDSTLPITILAIIAQSGWSIPQIFAANMTESVPRYKNIVANIGLFAERTPIFLFVLVAAFLTKNANLAVIVFLLLYAWFQFGAGMLGPAWQSMLGRVIPLKNRGKFLGLTTAIGVGMGIVGSGVGAQILKNQQFPNNFTILFSIAAISVFISWIAISLTREPPIQPKSHKKSSKQYLQELPAILKKDANFRKFLTARAIMSLGGLGYGFITVAVLHQWVVPDIMVGYFTTAMLAGQAAGNFLFGRIADKTGHKFTLSISALLSVVGYGLAWLAPTPEWFYVVFALIGITMGGNFISGTLMVMEFCEENQVPTYSGITNTLVGIIAAISPAFGGMIAIFSYPLLFMLSSIITLIGTLFLFLRVVEPRTTENTV